MNGEEELTQFEERRNNVFRGILKNVRISEFKWIIVVLLAIFAGLYYLEKIKLNLFLAVIGGIVLLIFLSGFGETEKMMELKEKEAKDIIERALLEKKKNGSNEFGLQNRKFDFIGDCVVHSVDGKHTEWFIGWETIDSYTGEENPHIASVDVWTGHITSLSRTLTSFTSEDKPTLRTIVPEEYFEFLDRVRGR